MDKNFRNRLIGASILLVTLAGVSYYNRSADLSNSEGNSPSLTADIEENQRIVNGLLKSSRISIGSPERREAVILDQVDQSIVDIINPDHQDIKAEIALFQNGKEGFLLSYDTPLSIEDNYNLLSSTIESKRWIFLIGLRTNKATILEVENDKYQLRIIGLANDPNLLSTKVSFEVVKK